MRGKRRRISLVRQVKVETEYEGPKRFCHCGALAPRWTAWSEKNPGRRFYGCRKYNQGGGCGYFSWHDNEMGQRSIEVISELLSHIDSLYGENLRLKRRLEGEGLGAEMC
ncbi:uncharacterized protein LOC114727520 [Neltuma alba]|uniref:uncharacterized protein LOC114727520 n=1 Tax=Neltuma alba TaxID=207710 RepID=UPI0010A45F92|nr:uncharacterized protein LOC114727520 [Prosopis alba]